MTRGTAGRGGPWGRAPRTTGALAPRRRAWSWVATGVVAALVATVAVVAGGYDARDTPRTEPGVWVARDAGQYGRLNTDTGELDTVRKVVDPSSVLQSAGSSVMLTNGNGRAWPIVAADPVDIGVREGSASAAADPGDPGTSAAAGEAATDPAATGVGMPDGTRDALVAGRFVAVRTEAGGVHIGTLRDAGAGADAGADAGAAAAAAGPAGPATALGDRLAALTPLSGSPQAAAEDRDGAAAGDGASAEPAEAGDAPPAAAAIALSDEGVLALYSRAEHTVSRYDIARLSEPGSGGAPALGKPEALSGDPVAAPQLALVGADWALLDAEDGRLFRAGERVTELDVGTGALLQSSSASAGDVLVADQDGLLAVFADGTSSRTEASGVPARPTEVDGVRYAAWLGAGAGALWRGAGDPIPLQFDDAVREESDLAPVIRSNGARAVLSEERTGMLWTVPDGALVPVSQWNLADPPQEVTGTVVVDDVPEQVAPTAVDDEFGARPGAPTMLPVLLNDFDPNERDVLTVVPASLSDAPVPEAFGTLELLADRQTLVVHPAVGASGEASFTYRITDGALESAAATVTVRIAPAEENTAPEWCPVTGCQREWGVPAIVPGGTLVAPVLEGWVDPEGDVMTLASVVPVRAADPVRALVTADGRLAVRHTDPSAGAEDIQLRVTVQDSRGASMDRELTLAVRPEAAPVVTGTAVTVAVGTPATVTPLDRAAGGSGSFTLVDAAPQTGSAVAAARPVGGVIEITASEPGVSTFAVTVRDAVTGAEATGSLRVTAAPDGAGLALPPLRAYVRPLADATVEVLEAIPGAASRALAVVDATVTEGELQADVIEHAQIRVAGVTEDGGPGQIGAADVTVSEGSDTARGRLSVFQVPETGGGGVIAVADAATVRVGSTVDIRVLENDVSEPGERLLLHPEVTGSGAPGELAFAAGGVLRYLAPTEPGDYRIGYTVFAASSPELSDTGEVIVTVTPEGSNRDPQPPTLTGRVTPGGSTTVTVPSSGVDPDGDRVRVHSVEPGADPRIAVNVARSGTALEVTASATAEPGTAPVSYTVSDDRGGSATGTLQVVVTGDGAGPPVTLTDQVRLIPGGSTVVQPLDNDVDPSGGTLQLRSVTPNVPGGADSAEYQRLAAALDDDELRRGRVTIRSDDALGTVSYRYTVSSSTTSSTAEGLIVVQTSERVGAQAPAVRDTVVSVRDRADLSGRGIDVLSGQVRWPAGDPASLQLSLWDEQGDNYEVVDGRITGTYDPTGDLVVFRVSGIDASGTDVASYGFLVIPPLEDLQLTLQRDLQPLEVAEGGTVMAAVGDLVDAGPGDRVELRDGTFPTIRSGASCEAAGSSAIRYAAGSGGPWTDVCRIEVRLRGQESWTALPVPVRVTPDEPVAELRPLTRTIAPGASETIDLADMVEWQGDRTGSAAELSFSVRGGGQAFEVAAAGSELRATANAVARPGTQEVVTVSVTGAGSSQAPLTLRVGESPRDLPSGATVSLRCTVGQDCTVDLVGLAGEHDPFAGKSGGGLRLVSVDGGACPVASFSVSGERRMTASWLDPAGAGGICTLGFTVRDAQGRTGTGSIEFDAQGLPDAPASIVQTGFTDSSATFRVALGGRLAHPAVTDVRLSGAGSTRCSPAGPDAFECVATGLRSGERHAFTARAVNPVGESAASGSVTGWAYRAPERPNITASALPDAGNTDQARGSLRVEAAGSRDTREFRVSIAGVDRGTISGPEGRADFSGLPAGSVSVVVTPVTALELPPVGGGSATGAEASTDARVMGAPILTGATLTSTGERSGKIAVSGAGAHSGETVTWGYAVVPQGTSPDCSAGGAASPEFGGLNRGNWYVGAACARSPFGVSSATTAAVQIGGAIPAPAVSYTIATEPSPDGAGVSYTLVGQPAVTGILNGATLRYSESGGGGETLTLNPDDGRPITVQQCIAAQCSDPAPVRATTVPRPVLVQPNTDTCLDPSTAAGDPAALAAAVRISAAARPAAQFELGAPSESTVPLTVSWGGEYGALQSVTLEVCAVPPPAP